MGPGISFVVVVVIFSFSSDKFYNVLALCW